VNTLRIGIVGCGEVVQIVHLPSFYQLGDKFRVTALCDVSRTVLDAVGDAAGVTKRYLDYRDLVGQPDVDAVLITNPHAYHAEVALAAIAAGKHVFVEKPMCLTLAEAQAISAAQRQQGVVVQVGYMRRYAPAFLQACQMVKEIGPIRLAHVRDVIGKNALIINQTSRVVRGTDIPAAVIEAGNALQQERLREAIGDAPADLQRAYMLMLGLSSHDLSAMRDLLGMPQRVLYAAKRQSGVYLTAAFDYGDFVCQFDTGVDNIPRFDASLEVFGTDKVIKVVYDTPYVRNLPIRLLVKTANGAGGVQEEAILPAWGDPFVAEWEAFYRSIQTGEPPKTGPDDFRLDLELFHAMVALMREPVPA
jgi:predicted dehydrogenase